MVLGAALVASRPKDVIALCGRILPILLLIITVPSSQVLTQGVFTISRFIVAHYALAWTSIVSTILHCHLDRVQPRHSSKPRHSFASSDTRASATSHNCSFISRIIDTANVPSGYRNQPTTQYRSIISLTVIDHRLRFVLYNIER